MARFFLSQPLSCNRQLELPAEVVKHVQVLRLQPGDKITVFNGQGGEYCATILTMGRKTVAIELNEYIGVERELNCQVELWPAIIDFDRLDWLVEKAVELGVSKICPWQATNSAFRLNAAKLAKKTAHWQAVAVAAMQQSGRTKAVEVTTFAAAGQLAGGLGSDELSAAKQLKIFLSLRQPHKMLTAYLPGITAVDKVVIIVGPQGGLTAQEEQLLKDGGAEPAYLGKLTLRAETAALAALSIVGCTLQS